MTYKEVKNLKNSRKLFFSLLFFLLANMLIVIVGCGKEEASQTNSKKIVLEFWNTMEGPEASIMPDIINKFHQKHPNIRIEQKSVNFYKAREKFKESVKAGAGPDLMRADRFWIPDFVKKGIIAEIKASKIKDELDDMVPIAKGVISYKDKYWAMPISVDCLALFYNKEHFKEKNLEIPQTFDEFTTAAKELTDASSGRYGFFIYPNGWYFEPFLYGFGAQYFSSDGKITINSNHALKAFEYLLYLKDTLKVVPPVNLRSKVYNTMINSFGSGQISMIFTGPWAIRSIIKGRAFQDNNSNLGISPIPEGPHGTFSPTGCQTIVISKNCKSYDAALKFIRYMFSADVQKSLSIINFGLPARRSVFAAPELKRDPYLQTFIRQLQMSRKVFNSPLRGEIYKPLGEKLKQVLNGDLKPEYALKDFTAEWKANFPDYGD
ncbi:MAG: extracellular solute-binding protein [Candidatus Rifleibacteriota bacterium]